MIKILLSLLTFCLVYWILPTLIGMLLWGRKLPERQIAFTFDDGPDPYYTPKLLDLLKKYKISATFFVLGEKVQQNPKLILRMHQEGHLIGMHNYTHHSNWFMLPHRVLRELNHTAAIVKEITGVHPVHYRPPWGLLTLLDLFFLKDFEVVLWSLMLWDWRTKGGSEKIIKRLLKGLKKGGVVILMHDSGETIGAELEAPKNTIGALEQLFREGRFKGYRCIRMDGRTQGGTNETVPGHVEKEAYCKVVDDMG